MNIIQIIEKKRFNKTLTKNEINFFIDNYIKGEVKDYQASSLLMAICINGMNDDEIFHLTDAMIKSGDTLDLTQIKNITVDKHSTGGVGDKVTLILTPLLASLGYSVCKMSGRGLGYTGGTIDKLESIPGFRTDLNTSEFIKQVKNIGVSIVGQNKNLVPADKLLYELRDVSGTVNSMALIASSIMSKKIAAGSDIIILDIKCGDGAFMKNLDDARCLANKMIIIGRRFNKKTIVHITQMNEPLGKMIGNSLEVQESLDFLDGTYQDADLKTLVYESLKEILGEDYKRKINDKISDLSAYNKFKELVVSQGGDIDLFSNKEINSKVYEYKAETSGYLSEIRAQNIGQASVNIGAGRMDKSDTIDYEVGIEMCHKVGDKVNCSDVVLKIYYKDDRKLKNAIEEIKLGIKIIKSKKIPEKIILDTIV